MDAVLPEEPAVILSPQKLSTVLAFLAIYLIWGSTFLAIKVAVATVPPFFAAALRFMLAGTILLLFVYLRKIPMPGRREWRDLAFSASILFVPSFAALFWAERTVPSGIASAMVATIPVWMALGEVFVLKHSSLQWRLIASTVCGVSGVCILALRGVTGPSHSLLPYVMILVGQITWSIGSLLTKNMRLPSSKPLVAGAQMAIAGVMLMALSAVSGELSPQPRVSMEAAMAIVYLAIPGSVIAFTAYIWLLGHFPATTVGSYAYVNPVVALTVGWWLGHETLDFRVFAGTALVLTGVVLTLRGNRAH